MRYAFVEELVGNTVILEQEEYRHQVKVLRHRVGTTLRLLDGRGRIGQGQIIAIETEAEIVEVAIEEVKHYPEPLPLELVVSLPRAGIFDRIVQKGVELGVTRILPLLSERSQVRFKRPAEREKKRQHWRKVAIASCKQSGNPFLPKIEPPAHLRECLSDNEDEFERLLLDPGAKARTGGRANPQLGEIELNKKRPTRLAFGPEGGFSRNELELFQARNYRAAGLGRRILRLETAVVAALVLVQARKENL